MAQVLDTSTDHRFFKHLRMSRDAFEDLLVKVDAKLEDRSDGKGGKEPLGIKKTLYIGLWYLANTSPYRDIAEKFGVTESTAHHATNEIIVALNDMKNDVICWPTEQEMIVVEQSFRDNNRIPGIIGCIDGSHIKIRAPRKQIQNDYVNRHQQHSFNLTAVCDHRMKFTFISAASPGGYHDQRALRQSELWGYIMDNSDTNHIFPTGYYHILGDSAYKLMERLIVPYKDNGRLKIEQKRFNRELSNARVIIENAFGWLKGRFRRLKYVDAEVSKIPYIITACCVLHNHSLEFTEYEEFWELVAEESSELDQDQQVNEVQPRQHQQVQEDLAPTAKGTKKRNEICNLFR